ncbi:MAG: WYL domain-containing protein [Alcaligenaceae bacterium]|nr:WYL domain-containing protein [Alcaligenaceae bacterium]
MALYQNRWLTIDYQNAASKRAERYIMPLGLAQQGARLYLVCRYYGYQNERSLAMHRIKKATVSAIDFKPPPEFCLQKYDDDGRFGFGEGQHIKLAFRIKKEADYHLLESRLSKDQKVTEYQDHYLINATVIDSGRLTWWLNGFGDQVWDISRKATSQ